MELMEKEKHSSTFGMADVQRYCTLNDKIKMENED